MKKFIFILIVLIGSGALIMISFSRSIIPKNQDMATTIDFSPGEKRYLWNGEAKAFESASLTGATDPRAFYYYGLSPVDGIYYRSTDPRPLRIEKKGTKTIIGMGSGVYIYHLQSSLYQFELNIDHIRIVPKEKGTFIVDNSGADPLVFSLDTFLDISLISSGTTVTNFLLFPSLAFRHTKTNIGSLKDADILRISLLDSIRYLSLNTVEDVDSLFSGGDTADRELFLLAKKNISDRVGAFSKLLTDIREFDPKKNTGTDSLLGASHIFFINDSKKEIALKNLLIESIVGLIKDTSSATHKKNLVDTMARMKEENQALSDAGLAILREYYFVALADSFSHEDGVVSSRATTFLVTARKILGAEEVKNQLHYSRIAGLFALVYFSELSQEMLNKNLEISLRSILETKILSKNDFLPFTFFVTEYLSKGTLIPNADTMKIISHLSQMSEDYYMSRQDQKEKIASTTSTIFYNYNRIYTKLYRVLLDTYIDITPKGMFLKKNHVEGGIPTIPADFLEAFTAALSKARSGTENKKNFIDENAKTIKMDTSMADNYTLITDTLKSFEPIESMLSNYPKHLSVLALNEENRGVEGILVQEKKEMSLDNLAAYLSTFNGVDIGGLKVLNNYKKDGFYQVTIPINGKTFAFGFWDEGHIIADVSYVDDAGMKHTFPNTTIVLDEKSVQMKTLFSGESDPTIRAQYDFKNFFDITFLKKPGVVIASGEPDTIVKGPAMTSDMEVFVQKELLDKDFRNIVSFFPILFNNIYATVTDGKYSIELSRIKKSFTGMRDGHPLEISGMYIFPTHSFSRLTFQVENPDGKGYNFNAQNIEILPARIPVLSLPEVMKDTGFYIDVIKREYRGQKSIIVDLSNKQVMLDGISHTPLFTTP